MQVFKLYLKLFRKSIPTLGVYLGVFLTIAIVSTISMKDANSTIFEESKVPISYINHDEESILLQGFKSYLGESSEFVEIEDTQEGILDALFFREVTYILVIPEGFTEDFLSGKEPVLVKQSVPDSIDAANIDMSVNNYLNTARIYHRHMEDLSQEQMVQKIAKDLNTQVKVDLYSGEIDKVDSNYTVFYYNYLVYAILSFLILGIGSIMVTFTNIDIKRRNFSSPITLVNFQFQQILATLSFALICDALLIFTGSLLSGESLFHKTSLLFIINVIVFTFAALSIAYLVGSLIKSREATNGIANVVGLGMSFISGVFVPTEYLGDTVIQIAKFTPAYWYTTANESIGNLTNFSWDNLSQIFGYMLIQLGFAVAIFSVSLVINKKKSTEAT